MNKVSEFFRMYQACRDGLGFGPAGRWRSFKFACVMTFGGPAHGTNGDEIVADLRDKLAAQIVASVDAQIMALDQFPLPRDEEQEECSGTGRISRRPDPTDNAFFMMYAQAHGLPAARAAFGLQEDDPYA